MTEYGLIQSITISRQLGSLGCEVARLIADELDYRFVWRELINQAGQRSGVPEVALAAIDELGLIGFCPSLEACHAYRKAIKHIMIELAEEGHVIVVGRAGFFILRDRPDVLHIRLIAPPNIRAERVSNRYNITLKCAQAQIEASDRFRSRYIKQFYNVSWDNSQFYDLVVNTGHFSSIEATQIILRALEQHIKHINEDVEVKHGYGFEPTE